MKKNTKVGFSLGRKALSSIKGAYFHGGLPSLFLLVFLCMGSMTLQAQFAGGIGRGDIVGPFSNTTEMSAPAGYIVASTDVKNVLTLTLTATGVRISDLHTAVSGNNLIITATNTKSEIVLDGAIPMGITTDGTSTVTVDLTTVTGFAGLAVVGGAAADTVVIGSGGIDLSVTPAGAANQLVRIDLGAAYTNILEAPNTIVSKAGGAIELKNAENFVVAAPLVATLDTVWLSLQGLITQTSPITAGTLRLGQVVNNAVYVLNHASNNVGVVQAITSGTVAYTDADDLRVRYVVIEEVPGKGQSSARGGTNDAVTITSPGAITVDSSGINATLVTGNVSLTSTGSTVTVQGAGVALQGDFTASSTGALSIGFGGLRNSTGTGTVGLTSTTGGVSISGVGVSSAGAVTVSASGAVSVGGDGLDNSAGTADVSLISSTSTVTVFGRGLISKGNVSLSASTGINVNGLTNSGGTGTVTITSTTGNIVASGAGVVSKGDITMSTAGNVTADGVNNLTGTGAVSLTSSAGSVTIIGDGVKTTSNVTAVAATTASIGGRGVTSGGNVSITAPTGILILGDGINNTSGTGMVSLVSSTGAVTIDGRGIVSGGNVSITAPTGFTLLGDGINNTSGTGTVNLVSSSGALSIDGAGVASKGAVTVTASGAVTISGSAVNNSTGTGGDVLITSSTGGVTIFGAGVISKGAVTVTASGTLAISDSGLNNSAGTGDLSLTSSTSYVLVYGGGLTSMGAVTISAATGIDVKGLRNSGGTGTVTFTSTTGRVSGEGVVSKGDITMSTAGELQVGDVSNISGTGALSFTSSAGQVLLREGDIQTSGNATIVAATWVSSNASLKSGGNVSVTAPGNIDFYPTSGINNTSGTGTVSLVSSGGAVSISGAGVVSKGDVTVTAPGNINIYSGSGINNASGTGTVSLVSSGGAVSIDGAGVVSKGNVSVTAPGAISLLSSGSGISNAAGTGNISVASTTSGVTIAGAGLVSQGGITVNAPGTIAMRDGGINKMSANGSVSVTSTGGGVLITGGGLTSGGNVTVLTDSIVVADGGFHALGKVVTVAPYDASTTIRLGGNDALNILGFTGDEFNHTFADTLVIGSTSTSSIQLTSAVKDSLLNVALVTTPTTGTLDLVDALTVKSINLNRVGKFTPSIISTTSAEVFKAYGPVILGNASLVLPTLPDGFVVGDKVTILENESVDPVVGTFIGLPEGDTLSGVDMSGRPIVCSISYVGSAANFTRGTVGNDIVLTVTKVSSSISGKIGWRTNSTVGIINTSVALAGNGTGTVTTLADGLYSFDISGSNYTVTPTKTTGKLNGVTALDVTRISQHVGGTLPFTNPLEYIAADINKSNSLNTSDASTLQNALLNNPIALNLFKNSWRFVPTGTMFSTPYGTGSFWNFPEKRTYTGITGSQTDQDFDAIKVGDLVTPSVNPALKPAPAVPVVFTVPEMALTVGALVEVPFRCEHFEDLVALQACFWFNPGVLALDAVLPLANSPVQVGNFGTWELAEGRLRMVWAVANAETKSGNPELFKLRFRVLQGGYGLGDVLHISQKDMEASAWHTDYRPEPVELVYAPVTETQQRGELAAGVVGFELYQNEPNPFADKTTIAFQLPTAATATLTVYDESGRVVFTQKSDYAKGYNAIVLDRSLLKTSGVMYYTLETPTDSATKKMVQIK